MPGTLVRVLRVDWNWCSSMLVEACLGTRKAVSVIQRLHLLQKLVLLQVGHGRQQKRLSVCSLRQVTPVIQKPLDVVLHSLDRVLTRRQHVQLHLDLRQLPLLALRVRLLVLLPAFPFCTPLLHLRLHISTHGPPLDATALEHAKIAALRVDKKTVEVRLEKVAECPFRVGR